MSEDYPGQAYIHKHNANIKRAEENAMSEQRAGRGEGLAGLVREVLEYAIPGFVDHDRTCEVIADELNKRWLEAAAPPSTAHDEHWAIKAQCAHCVDSYPQRQDGDGYIPNLGPVSDGEWFHHGMVNSSSGVVECAAQYIHEALRAALATASPQAPPEQSNAFSPTSVREQSSATAASSPSAASLVSWARVVIQQLLTGIVFTPETKQNKPLMEFVEDAHEFMHETMPAATQEQPAGSAGWTPSAKDHMDLKEKFNAHIPATDRNHKGPATLDRISGSPRKVGEDGALRDISPEEIAGIQQGLRDIADGRTKPIEQIRAELLAGTHQGLESGALREALQRIRDEDPDCLCEHDNENCCVNVDGMFCARCIAAAALSLSSPIEPAPVEHKPNHCPVCGGFPVDANEIAAGVAKLRAQASSEIREALQRIHNLVGRAGFTRDTLQEIDEICERALAPSRQGAGGK